MPIVYNVELIKRKDKKSERNKKADVY